MLDEDTRIREELSLVLRDAPLPVSASQIDARLGSEPSASWKRVAVGAAFVALVGVGAVAVLPGQETPRQEGTASRIESAASTVPTTPTVPVAPFVETVDWPHYVPTFLPDGVSLQLVEEVRPAGLSAASTQVFSVVDSEENTLSMTFSAPGGAALDAGPVVAGGPLSWLDDQGAPNEAIWERPEVSVYLSTEGISRSEAEQLLAQLVPRQVVDGDDSTADFMGFDVQPGAEIVLKNELIVAPDQGQGAVVRSWFGTDEQIDYELQAVITNVAEPDLALVGTGSGDSVVEQVGERQVKVEEFDPWTTAMWFDDDGTLLSLHARNIDRATLFEIVAGVAPVDQDQWDEVVQAQRQVVAQGSPTHTAEIGDLGLSAMAGPLDPNGLTQSSLCLRTSSSQDFHCRQSLARRDGGPYVEGPTGILNWTVLSAGLTSADVVVDGVWWIVVFNELDGAGAGPGLTAEELLVEAGETTFPMMASDDGRWFVASVPSEYATVKVVLGDETGFGIDRWRPSHSGR